MKFLSNILVKAGLIVEGSVDLQGNSTAVTPSSVDSSTKIATTAFVKNQDYVPYLPDDGIAVSNVQYDTTPPSIPTAQGSTYWDAANETIAVILNGYTMRVGEDLFYPVKNKTGVTIPKGTAVRFNGTLGSSGRLLIAPFIANGSVSSTFFMGVAAEDIANGDDGRVLWFGRLRGINTGAYNEGDVLYASTSVAGGFQTTIPQAPNNIIEVAAVVTKSANNGVIFIRPSIGSNISKDEGVKITSANTGDLLQYQSNGLWENKTKAQVLGGTLSQFVKGDGSLDSTIYLSTIDASGLYVPLTRTVNGKALSSNIVLTTSDILEGSNLYYTDARARAAVSQGTGITYNSSTGVITNAGVTSFNGFTGDITYTAPVTSVNGATGAVVLTTTNISEGSNLYFTNARSRSALSFAAGSGAYDSSTGVITIPTNTNQLTNGAGFISTISGISAGGELSGTYPNPTLVNSAVTGKVLTGLNVTGGSVNASDTILSAFGKVQNQINGLLGGSIFQTTWNASTNSPALTSSVGTKGYYYIVSVAGSTNLDGITDWQVGDWAIFDGSVWRKVDNTDAVVSVNGFTGAVSLTTANISESGNLYYTDARARNAISVSGSLSYNPTTGVISYTQPTNISTFTNDSGYVTTAGARSALSFAAGSGAYNSSTGVITIPTNTNQLTNGAGYITGNQTITLSGDVSGSGATSISVSIGALKVTNAMLAGSISDDKILSAATWNAKQNALNGTGFVRFSGTTPSYITGTSSQFVKADGTLDSSTYLTTGTAASTYLPLSGGSLTGVLTMRRADVSTGDYLAKPSFSVDFNGNYWNSSTGNIELYTGSIYGIPNASNVASAPSTSVVIKAGSTNVAFFSSTGATTLSGALNGTSVSMSSSVTATSFIRSGGTSSQFLKADGSVDGTSYATAASISGTTNYIPKFTSASAIGNSRVVDNFGIGLFANDAIWFDQGTGNGRQWGLYYDGSVLKTRIANSDALGFSIASSGQMTLSSQLNGTSLSMSGGATANFVNSNTHLAAKGSFGGYTGAGVFMSYEGYGGRIESYDYGTTSYKDIAIAPNGGNVLIGTTTTDGTNKLIVNGGVRATSGAINGDMLVGALTSSSTGRITATQGLTYTNSGDSRGHVHLINTNNTAGNRASLQFYNSQPNVVAGIDAILTHTSQTGSLRFWTVNNGSLSDALLISNTGAATFSSSVTANDNVTVTKSTGTLLDVRATATGGNVEVKLNPVNNNSYSLYTAGSTDALEFKRGTTTLVTFSNVGAATFSSLSGSGNRIVFANSSGTLGSMVIGSGLAFDGTTLTATGGSAGTISGSGTSGYVTAFTGASSVGNSIIQTASTGITIGSGQNTKIRLGLNGSDWGEVEYMGGVTTLRNGWDNANGYVQQLVNGQYTRLFGSGIFDHNRTSEGIFYRGLTNGNGRFTIGTNASANVEIRTGNNVSISIGVNEAALSIVNGGAATFLSSVTATSFFESSDGRLKTLIADNYEVPGIELITPKLYKKNGKAELGYFAQDFIGVLDSAVTTGEDGMLSLSYREVMVAKIYALEQEVKMLKEKYGVQ